MKFIAMVALLSVPCDVVLCASRSLAIPETGQM